MDTKSVAATLQAQEYAKVCLHIKHIESIQLDTVYSILTTHYLAYLILPIGEACLPIYQEHLADPYSWLAQAQYLSKTEAQHELVAQYIQSTEGTLEQALWQDVEKKLTYLMASWSKDKALAAKQILQGIETLLRDHIPLRDVQSEIIEFAQKLGIFPEQNTPLLLSTAIGNLAQILQAAKEEAILHFNRMAKTTLLQADLFLNRLAATETSLADLDLRQSFLFYTNQYLCLFIQHQIQELRSMLDSFETLRAAKMRPLLEEMDVESILQRYSFDAKRDAAISAEEEILEQALTVVEQIIPDELVEATAELSITELEKLLEAREQLLLTVMQQMARHRLQLSCSSRIKACYKKFSLFPVMSRITLGLNEYQDQLKNSLHEVKHIHKKDIEAVWKDKLKVMIDTFEIGLQRIENYMSTLDATHLSSESGADIPIWQKKLHDLIFLSSEADLLMMDRCLQRIAALDNPYLRATLVMRLKVVQEKLNPMIFANMQSWSARYVEQATVMNTLSYLGVTLPPHHLVKIISYLQPDKPESHKRRLDFYTHMSEYGIGLYKNIRLWLDKRIPL